jgi:hypothetical protein
MNEMIKLNNDSDVAEYSQEFLDKVKRFEKILTDKHINISNKATPKGKIKKDGQGFDYVTEGYLREQLNKEFPMWSWEPTDNPVQFIGAEWVVVSGFLKVLDNGIERKFFSPGAARIQFKKSQPHTPENVIDVDNNLGAANSNALKRAINRLCNIADDVYRKVIDPYATQETLKKIEKMMGLVQPEVSISVRNYINEKNGELTEQEALRVVERLEQLC